MVNISYRRRELVSRIQRLVELTKSGWLCNDDSGTSFFLFILSKQSINSSLEEARVCLYCHVIVMGSRGAIIILHITAIIHTNYESWPSFATTKTCHLIENSSDQGFEPWETGLLLIWIWNLRFSFLPSVYLLCSIPLIYYHEMTLYKTGQMVIEKVCGSYHWYDIKPMPCVTWRK